MNLAVYMLASTFIVFFIGAAVMLAWSVASGQWRDVGSAAMIVLADDDPEPTSKGA